MKKITYDFLSAEIDNEGVSEKVFITKQMTIADKDFAEAIPYIEKEAYNGEYFVEDIADLPGAPTLPESDIWDELDSAYENGINSI
jgi:hypothetical protein